MEYKSTTVKVVRIPYKGDIESFLQDMFGSLRSTGTYIGARRLKEFPKRATFVRVNRQLTTYLEQYDTGK